MSYFIPNDAKVKIKSGAFVCRHRTGHWNSVSSDQFGEHTEQTGIRIGKGGLRGITLSPEKVSEWIDSFPLTAYVSDCLEHCFPCSNKDAEDGSSFKHKEEGEKDASLIKMIETELFQSFPNIHIL